MAHRDVLAVDFCGNQGQLFAMEEEPSVGGVRIGGKAIFDRTRVLVECSLNVARRCRQVAKGGVVLEVDRLGAHRASSLSVNCGG